MDITLLERPAGVNPKCAVCGRSHYFITRLRAVLNQAVVRVLMEQKFPVEAAENDEYVSSS